MIGGFKNPILTGATAVSMNVNFIASTQTPDFGATVSFTNLSSPTPLFNFWEFGDGSFSTASNPDKMYTSTGTFSVTLNACDEVSGGIETKTDYIIIKSLIAKGGTETIINVQGQTYKVHTFTDIGQSNFEVTNLSNVVELNKIEYLVIGGGGGGGNSEGGGGGGAGGYRTNIPGETSGGQSIAEPDFIINTIGTYSVTVGDGGDPQMSGQPSSFDSIISLGGGAGGGNGSIGSNGGSGGGGSHPPGGGAVVSAGAGTIGQGFEGGSRQSGNTFPFGGGGGGGAGQSGRTNLQSLGQGGFGLISSITGTPIQRAGGGGAGVFQGQTSTGGAGGGGNGGNNLTNPTAGANATGSGGGGAGGSTNRLGAKGGSGVVIIRYKI